MISEWMKVMLGEIARKKAESEQVRVEEQRRRDEALAQPRCVGGVVIESATCAREKKIGDAE
jgi:hypothetical protein